MRLLKFALLSCMAGALLASAGPTNNDNRVDCDVAVLGGGAGGASAAVFLKDKGYKVCLFERRGRLGGNCQTTIIPPSQLPAGCTTCPNWVDRGVEYYENSTYLRKNGIGRWNLATDEFITRFVPSGTAIQIDYQSIPNDLYGVYDFNQSIGPILASGGISLDTATLQAYGRLVGALMRYSWIDTVDAVPDVIPDELLQPFGTFIQTYNLYPLISTIFPATVTAQGIWDWENTPTLYALYNVKSSILELTKPTKAGLAILGGCARIFDGIRNYLGDSSVYLNADVQKVERPNGLNNNGVIKITASIGGAAPQVWKVNKVIIAFAPKTSSMGFLDSDNSEKALFAKVRTRMYWPSLVTVTGAAQGLSYAFFNVKLSNTPFLLPTTPALVTFSKLYRYGPAKTIVMFDGETEPTREEAIAFVNSQLSRAPASLFDSATTDNIFRHQYEPYFLNKHLSETPNPFVQFRNIQGVKNTYYVGGLLAAPGSSSVIFEHSYNLINQHF